MNHMIFCLGRWWIHFTLIYFYFSFLNIQLPWILLIRICTRLRKGVGIFVFFHMKWVLTMAISGLMTCTKSFIRNEPQFHVALLTSAFTSDRVSLCVLLLLNNFSFFYFVSPFRNSALFLVCWIKGQLLFLNS